MHLLHFPISFKLSTSSTSTPHISSTLLYQFHLHIHDQYHQHYLHQLHQHHPVRVWKYVTVPPHPSPSSLTPCDWTSPSSACVRVLYYEGSTARRVTAKLPVLRPWFWNLMFPEKKIMVSPRALVAQLGATDCLRCLMCGSRWLSCVYWMMSVRDLFRKTVIWRPVILFLFHGHQNGT